jgi:hypothetical protein
MAVLAELEFNLLLLALQFTELAAEGAAAITLVDNLVVQEASVAAELVVMLVELRKMAKSTRVVAVEAAVHMELPRMAVQVS